MPGSILSRLAAWFGETLAGPDRQKGRLRTDQARLALLEAARRQGPASRRDARRSSPPARSTRHITSTPTSPVISA